MGSHAPCKGRRDCRKGHVPSVRLKYNLSHIITLLTSGTLNCARAGPVEREKNKQKNNPKTRGHTNETIHQPTTLYYSSTAVRSTAVTPTKRSTHPPCVSAAVQQMTYSSSRCVSSSYAALHRRESGESAMGPENKSTKHVKHP